MVLKCTYLTIATLWSNGFGSVSIRLRCERQGASRRFFARHRRLAPCRSHRRHAFGEWRMFTWIEEVKIWKSECWMLALGRLLARFRQRRWGDTSPINWFAAEFRRLPATRRLVRRNSTTSSENQCVTAKGNQQKPNQL